MWKQKAQNQVWIHIQENEIVYLHCSLSTCASQACCTSAFWHFVILDRPAMSSTSSRATPTPERVNSVPWSTDRDEENSLYWGFYHDSFCVTGFVLSRTYWCCVSHMDCPPVLCRSVPASGGLRTSAGPGRTRMSSLFYVSRPRMLGQEMGKDEQVHVYKLHTVQSVMIYSQMMAQLCAQSRWSVQISTQQ